MLISRGRKGKAIFNYQEEAEQKQIPINSMPFRRRADGGVEKGDIDK